MKEKPRNISYLVAGWISGLFDSTLHPLDTIAKRFQQHGSIPKSYPERFSVIFPNNVTGFRAFTSLYAGYVPSVLHKFTIRGIIFGSQPYLENFVKTNFGTQIEARVGKKHSTIFQHFIVGAGLGAIEGGFLPVDKLKIKKQLGSTETMLSILKKEKWQMYNGLTITAIRNIQGLSTLFGVTEFVKKTFFHQEPELTWKHNLCASFIASIATIIVTNPADCLKTRLQNSDGRGRIRDAAKVLMKEGPKCLVKGITPRLVNLGPRFMVGKTIVDTLTPKIDKKLDLIFPTLKRER